MIERFQGYFKMEFIGFDSQWDAGNEGMGGIKGDIEVFGLER